LRDKTQKKGSKAALWPKVRVYFLVHLLMLGYSLAGVCSKTAAAQPFGSIPYFAWYLGALVILGVFALVWQQVLKVLPLTSAFCNKGITLVWGMLWGALFFGEQIKLNMLIGAAIVFGGVILVAFSEINKEDTSKRIQDKGEPLE
jgi:drug/metabolite transporter (DMT)-like permease